MFLFRIFGLTLLVSIVLCAGCGHAPVQRPQSHSIKWSKASPAQRPQSLIVLLGAKDVQDVEIGNTRQVAYTLTEKYPAKNALNEISNTLSKQGWKPLKNDFLNPGLPSSHVRGWTDFVDATREPNQQVQQWLAQWTNQAGDVTSYTLRYNWVVGNPINTDKLEVNAIYISAKVADAQRSLAAKTPKEK